MSGSGIEIERKYRLRATPAAAELAARESDRWRIEQAYLGADETGMFRRVRRVEHADGSVEHILTRKRSLAGRLGREEIEEPIDPVTYAGLLATADPARRTIRKTRHVVPHGGQVLEIDVFDEPPGLVVVEVELRDEAEPVELPAWLGPAWDVTDDHAYTNASLARLDARVPPMPGPSARPSG